MTLRSQGAELLAAGVRYRTWAPGQTKVEAVIAPAAGGAARVLSLGEEPGGYFCAIDPQGRAGDRYKYRFGGGDWPDPASRFNPEGVHGAAQVVDPSDYEWHDADWSPPSISQLIIYEAHIGTFTPEGTFREAIAKLDHLVALGVTALEIMPVADFPGNRNWGYDGVLPYAPARVYGKPNDLRALVDAAHERGLAIILDVVYNHLGPDGNYLGVYSRDYFNPSHKTPWGDAFRFELQPVRDFFTENLSYWQKEFHVDGFRLDATHAIIDSSERHVLAEIAERVHSLGGFVIAEDERNEPQLVRSRGKGGLGLDAIWADDFHHVIRVMLTGVREGYYKSYNGTVDELAATLEHGWLFEGGDRFRRRLGEPGDAAELPPEKFVLCITNHDQIGNQAFGTRLNHLVSPAAFRAASALLCLVPFTPLILMGQEWSASSPFQFFTDHEPRLGRLVRQGRRDEFRAFSEFRDPAARAKIPDPQAEETFLQCKLHWEEIGEDRHAGALRLYQDCFRLRRELAAFRDRERGTWQVPEPDDGVVRLCLGRGESDQVVVCADLLGSRNLKEDENPQKWRLLLSSNHGRFGGGGRAAVGEPETRVFQSIA